MDDGGGSVPWLVYLVAYPLMLFNKQLSSIFYSLVGGARFFHKSCQEKSCQILFN